MDVGFAVTLGSDSHPSERADGKRKLTQELPDHCAHANIVRLKVTTVLHLRCGPVAVFGTVPRERALCVGEAVCPGPD